ncbi:MAG: hypothetical protein KBC69_01395 [Candidatus Magasanikbacteria bacterium]|nr:hypothetical protein [Candidatus Magasanikbacteria bacterium]
MINEKYKILTDAGYEIYCDTVKLRELDLPIVDFDIDKLIWNFDLPLWEKDGTDDWNLTPWDVINKVEGSSIHQERVKQADLQFPILLLNKNDKWLVIDGVHRLVKAFQAQQKTIRAKVYTLELVEKYPR